MTTHLKNKIKFDTTWYNKFFNTNNQQPNRVGIKIKSTSADFNTQKKSAKALESVYGPKFDF
jgi:hypothetical protein